MMKMMIISLIGVLCLSSTSCKARRLLEDDKKNIDSRMLSLTTAVVDLDEECCNDSLIEEDENGSKHFGYLEADNLWTNGGSDYYNCDNCYGQFWVDVKEKVFATCEQKWDPNGFWAQEQLECKAGAEEYTMQQFGKCFGTTDNCHQLGMGAGASVAGALCEHNGLFHNREWLPRECKDYAVTTCQCDAVKIVQEYIDGNVCDPCAGTSALEHVQKIYDACVQEVNEMETEAKLEW